MNELKYSNLHKSLSHTAVTPTAEVIDNLEVDMYIMLCRTTANYHTKEPSVRAVGSLSEVTYLVK